MYQNIVGWVALIGAAQYFGFGELAREIASGFSDPVAMLGHAVEFVRSALNR
jgi:hypothetical protein